MIDALRPLLASGEHDMPGPPGYRLRVTIDGATLAATVFRGPAPLATVWTCLDDRGLAEVLRVTGARPAVLLAPPCVLASLHRTMTLDPDAIGWLGDFERCLAWAWSERWQQLCDALRELTEEAQDRGEYD